MTRAEHASVLPFNLTLEQFHTIAIDVLKSLNVPFDHPLEISNTERHPDSDPETIETTMWASGAARLSIVKLADRHVAMESTDRSCYGTLEGLPGDVVLRVDGDGAGRLGHYGVSGDDENAVVVVEREWLRAIAELAKSCVFVKEDPLLPDAWREQAAHLPVVAPCNFSLDFGYGRLRRKHLWQIHETLSGPYGVWVQGYPRREIPGAQLVPIGPLPTRIAGGVLGASAIRELPLTAGDAFHSVVGRSLPAAPEWSSKEDGVAAARYRDGGWILRVRSRPRSGTAWLQHEHRESPMMWMVWSLEDVHHGVSGDAAILLLGEHSAVDAARQRLADWLHGAGWRLRESSWRTIP